MKWLILSCSTGEGHNSAARAIIEAAEKSAVTCAMIDPVSFGGKWAETAVSAFYNKMIQKTPAAFGMVYRAGELYDRVQWPSPVYLANALYANKLRNYIRREKFDAVICTHLYGMEAMTALRKRLGDTTPCFGVLTDYTCIPFFAETTLDRYFIPHKDLTAELAGKGLPAEKLVPTGIPVFSVFSKRADKAHARSALAIPVGRRVYLVMSGGMGSGNLQSLCDQFLKKESGDFAVNVLVGRNDGLCDRLQNRYKGNPHISVVTFTKRVHLYMEAADVMISKSGGLSSTEAMVLGIPLVHLFSIPGCETKNAIFFSDRGLSVRAASPADAVDKAKELINDPRRAEQMRISQRLHAHPDAAERIVKEVIRYVC